VLKAVAAFARKNYVRSVTVPQAVNQPQEMPFIINIKVYYQYKININIKSKSL